MWIKRLLRRVRWLLFYQWQSLTLDQWPYESCWMCGKSFRIVWSVEDKYWIAVVGVEDGSGGSLCLDCFLWYADSLDIVIPSDAIELQIFKSKG